MSADHQADRLRELLGHLPSLRRFLHPRNLVAFALPAASILLLLVIDLWAASRSFPWGSRLLALYASHPWRSTLVALVLLSLVGWLMYLTKYYRLFLSYRARKARFRETLADVFPRFSQGGVEKKRDVGAYLYKSFWRVAEGPVRREALMLHVQWVALVHISNNLLLSLVVLLLFLTPGWLEEQRFSLNWVSGSVLVAHVVFYFYFRGAALDRLDNCDSFIRDEVERLSTKILEDVPGGAQ